MPLIRKPSTPATSDPDPGLDSERLLTHADADVRWKAARALADKPQSAAALARAVAIEPSSNVREAIFTSLMRIGTLDSAKALAALLRSDDAALRTGAMDALANMIETARPLLSDLLSDPDADVRILSCDLTRSLPPSEATPLLAALLDRETQRNVCGAAIDVLAEIGTADAAPALQRCAARFADDSYLAFAIQEAVQAITAHRSSDG